MNGWKTLVVDDEQDITSHLTTQLSRIGLLVHVAHDYKEGQFMIDHYPYDMAVLDIFLPDGSGIELFRMLKKKNPELYTIMITGHATVENAITALNEGVNAYLIKPFSEKQLFSVLHQAEKTLRLKVENKALFQEIQLNRQFYEDVLNSTSEAILVVDLDYRIQYSNRAAAELLYLSEDFPNKSLLENYIEDGYKILSHIYQQLVQGKSVAGYRVTIKTSLNKTFDAHLTADFLYGKNEHIEGLIINLSNPLIHNEVLNRILRKEKLTTIVRLANVLNHEIRNPINILFGRLQLLKDEIKNREFDKSFPSIQRQIDRILYITDLLSKFNFIREDTIPEKCAISEIFQEVLDQKKKQFEQKNLKLSCSLQKNGFYVEGNVVQFSEAFGHLLDTISEITPDGGNLEIYGKETRHYAPAKWYEFQFFIPDVKLNTNELFEPYQSVDMEMNGLIGLGMAIMHTIFNNYGARIESSAHDDGKTLIRIRFPLFEEKKRKPVKSRKKMNSKISKRRSAN